MYQTNTTEEGFRQLMEAFERLVVSQEAMSKDNEMWDMTSTYSPNHATLWNHSQNIGKTCKIIQKNDTMALVSFSDSEDEDYGVLECLYRLEDLSIHNPQGNNTPVFIPNPGTIYKIITYNRKSEMTEVQECTSQNFQHFVQLKIGGWDNIKTLSDTPLPQKDSYITTGISNDGSVLFTVICYSG